jgi:DNA-binding NtrC family response regulator
MSVALLSLPKTPLSKITTLLRREGISITISSAEWENSLIDISEETGKVVLIVESHGIAEVVDRIKEVLGEKRKLILCCPQQSNANYELLADLGVDEFITPQSWSSYHIAERILGQLIIEGEIETTGLGKLCGATTVMREIYEEIQTVAALSDPILILGETGTGKNVVAYEIHRLSGRGGNFITLNCSEFNPELIESELFGHSKGSFTSAKTERQGLLLESGTGTVFLATNRDVESEIEKGVFRHDLYERISGFTLQLPALRGKLADIPLLFNLFLKEYCEEYNKEIHLPPTSLDALFGYSWRGNARELRAFVRNLSAHAVMAEDKFYISPLRIAETISGRKVKINAGNSIIFDPATETLEDVLTKAENNYFRILLDLTGDDREKAIQLSGLSKSTFYEKIKRLTKRAY